MSLDLARPCATIDDYLALPDTIRAELLSGALYVTPSPRSFHQDVVGALYAALRAWVRTHRAGRAFVSPLDVYLPTGDIVQPDVVCLLGEGTRIVQERGLFGAPSLLIEVLSPSNPERDRIVKRDCYARSGVEHYWIVDPSDLTVETFRLTDKAYQPAGWYTGNATIVSAALPGFALPLAELFERYDS